MTASIERKTKLRDEKWLRQMAELEEQCPSVSVGGMASDLGMLHLTGKHSSGLFGRFVEFARRKDKLSQKELANRTGVALREIAAIEKNPGFRPHVTTVEQLAKFLQLPPEPLMELAGLVENCGSSIETAAVRFIAQAESNAELSPHEERAFDEFMKVIAGASD
jgi:transcriptional regulator with XRE-family HTH domain